MKSAAISFLVIILFSCDPTSNFIEIRNSSNIPVYVQLGCSDTLNLFPRLESMEMIVNGKDTSFVRPDYFIKPFASTKLALHGDWLQFADRCEGGSIKLFFIQEDQIKGHDWEYLVKHQLFWQKVEVTSQYLKENNFKVEFISED